MRLGTQTGDDSARSAQPDVQALVQQLVLNRIPAPGLLRIDQVATIYSLLYTVYSVLSTLYCLFCTVDCLLSGSNCLAFSLYLQNHTAGTMKMQGIDTIFELHAKVCCFV